MTRRIYPNPPITEAVVEFRFPRVPGGVVGSLRDRLANSYPAQSAQDLVEAQFAIDDTAVTTSTRRSHHRTVLESATGTRLLTCADDALGVHVLRPYPGWENFLDQIQEATDALPETVRKGQLDSIGVRYVNQFNLAVDIPIIYDEYLTVVPPRPETMPEELVWHRSSTRTVDQKTNTTFEIHALLSADPSVVGIDILVHRKVHCSFHEWQPILEDLHAVERHVFEECVTDTSRRLFQ